MNKGWAVIIKELIIHQNLEYIYGKIKCYANQSSITLRQPRDNVY